MTTRLAYLRGDGVEMAVHADRIRQLKDVAKNLGLRRLVPVPGDLVPGDGAKPATAQILVKCMRCGVASTPDKMLLNLDKFYSPSTSYEHERCPQ